MRQNRKSRRPRTRRPTRRNPEKTGPANGLVFFPVNPLSVQAAAAYYKTMNTALVYRNEVREFSALVQDLLAEPLLSETSVNENQIALVVDQILSSEEDFDKIIVDQAKKLYPMIGSWQEFRAVGEGSAFGLLSGDGLGSFKGTGGLDTRVYQLSRRIEKANYRVTVAEALGRKEDRAGAWRAVLPSVAIGRTESGLTGVLLGSGSADNAEKLVPIKGGFLHDRTIEAMLYEILSAGLWDFSAEAWVPGKTIQFALPSPVVDKKSKQDLTGSMQFANEVCAPGWILLGESEGGPVEAKVVFSNHMRAVSGKITLPGSAEQSFTAKIDAQGTYAGKITETKRPLTVSPGKGGAVITFKGDAPTSIEMREVGKTRDCLSPSFTRDLKAQAIRMQTDMKKQPVRFLLFFAAAMRKAGNLDLAKNLESLSRTAESHLVFMLKDYMQKFHDNLESLPFAGFIGNIPSPDGIPRYLPAFPATSSDRVTLEGASWYGTEGPDRFVAVIRSSNRRRFAGAKEKSPPTLFMMDFLSRALAPTRSDQSDWAQGRRAEIRRYRELALPIQAAAKYSRALYEDPELDDRAKSRIEDRAHRDTQKTAGLKLPISIPLIFTGPESESKALSSVVFTVYALIDDAAAELVKAKTGKKPEVGPFPTYGILWQSPVMNQASIARIISMVRKSQPQPPPLPGTQAEVLPGVRIPLREDALARMVKGKSHVVVFSSHSAIKIKLKPGGVGVTDVRGRPVYVRYLGPRSVKDLKEAGYVREDVTPYLTEKENKAWSQGRKDMHVYEIRGSVDFPALSDSALTFNPLYALRAWIAHESGLYHLAEYWKQREEKKEGNLDLPFSIVGDVIVDTYAIDRSERAAKYPSPAPLMGSDRLGRYLTSMKIPSAKKSNVPDLTDMMVCWSSIERTQGLYPHTVGKREAGVLAEQLVKVGWDSSRRQVPLVGHARSTPPLFTLKNVKATPNYKRALAKAKEQNPELKQDDLKALAVGVYYQTILFGIASAASSFVPEAIRGGRRAFGAFGGAQARTRRGAGSRHWSPSVQGRIWSTEKQGVYVNIISFAGAVATAAKLVVPQGVMRTHVEGLRADSPLFLDLYSRYGVPAPDHKNKQDQVRALKALRDAVSIEYEHKISVGILPEQLERASTEMEDLEAAFAHSPQFAAEVAAGSVDPVFSSDYIDRMAKLNGRRPRKPRKPRRNSGAGRRSKRNPLPPDSVEKAILFASKGEDTPELREEFNRLRKESDPNTWQITQDRLGRLFPREGKVQPSTWRVEDRLKALEDFDMVSRVRHEGMKDWAESRKISASTLEGHLLTDQLPFSSPNAAAYIAQRAGLSLEEATKILSEQRTARERPYTMQPSSAICKSRRSRRLTTYDAPKEMLTTGGPKKVIILMSPVGVYPPRVMTFRRNSHIDCDMVGKRIEDLPDLLGLAIQSALFWVGENPRRRANNTDIFVGRIGDPNMVRIWRSGQPLTLDTVTESMGLGAQGQDGFSFMLYTNNVQERNKIEVEKYIKAARDLLGPSGAHFESTKVRGQSARRATPDATTPADEEEEEEEEELPTVPDVPLTAASEDEDEDEDSEASFWDDS